MLNCGGFMVEIRTVGMGQNRMTEVTATVSGLVVVVGYINHLGRFSPRNNAHFEYSTEDLNKISERCKWVLVNGPG